MVKRVGVREFRDHATKYLAGDEVLAIERHGQPIGYYIPTSTSRGESKAAALERFEKTINEVLTATGLSEDDLRRLFDLTQPIYLRPEQLEALRWLAAQRNISVAELVRQGVDRILEEIPPEEDPLLGLIGLMKSGHSDLSVRHDEYLAEMIREENQ